MVASVQKNTTEFLTEYLHFSCPFDNFLRCLACATYIAVGKKVLSTTDVHGQYRNQIPTTSKFLPAWYWDWHQPSMPNCPWDYSCCDGCQGNVFIEYREKSGNTKEGLKTTMHIPIPGCIFSLFAGAAQAVAQLENGLYSSSSRNQKKGKEIHLPHPTVLLLSTASSA